MAHPFIRPACFYLSALRAIFRVNRHVAKHGPNRAVLARWALTVLGAVEDTGGRVHLEGLDHVRSDGPVVYIGNHMSSLETIVLPGMLFAYHEPTFVVKESLLRYPLFGPVLQSLDPIAVTRHDARADLKTVLTRGKELLASGRSIIIFPQRTRATAFDPATFSSLGVKLALRVGVPVIPVALKTDFWGNGTWIKDLGRVGKSMDVHFAFDAPRVPSGNGKSVHAAVTDFISNRLEAWQSS